jgi:hypothetical protein
MFIGAAGGLGGILPGIIGKTPDALALDAFSTALDGQKDPAKSAASNTSFPTVAPVHLDTSSLLALQGEDMAATEKLDRTAEDKFLDYMKQTPEERIRDKILKALGITEEDLEAMTPDERLGLEEKIREIIKETLVKGAADEAAAAGEPAGATPLENFMLQLA